MTNSYNFKLTYEGPVLTNSTIDVADLAPALLNINEALSSINSMINKNDARVNLQVRAFNRGYFIIDFVLNQDFLAQVGALFAGVAVTGTCNAYNLIKCLIDTVALKKWLSGNKPDKVDISDDKSNVTIYYNDHSRTINYYSYCAWKNPKTNAACSKIVEPLKSEGLDSVQISSNDFDEVFTKSDVEAISAAPDDVVLTSNISKCVVMLETAAFKDNAKWRVKIGEQNSVYVSISDENFLRSIDAGIERFGKGDVLLVNLETSQTLSDGKLIVTYDIKNVIEHKTSAEQLSLF